MERLAYVEPVVGLNVYGRELLPHLARYYEVEVVTDTQREALAPEIAEAFPIRGYDDLPSRRHRYSHLVFHLRNNFQHAPVYDLLMRLGGVAVMHEITLVGIIGSQTLARGQRLDFLRHVWLNEGPGTALRVGMDIFVLRRGVKRWTRLPMNRRAVRRSRGVIVHNRDAAQQLRACYPHLPVQTVRRGVPPPRPFDRETLRQTLGLADRWPVIASFGVVAARKRIPQVLQALVEVVRVFPRTVYVLVGRVFDLDVQEMAERLGVADHVVTTGQVDDETFHRYLAVTDIGVNLRYPSEGETSSTALRLLGYGKPILVTDAGSLAELPDSCALKVSPGPQEVVQIREGLLRLARDEALCRQMGEAARRYIARFHTWEQAAQSYRDFLEGLA